MEDKEFKSLVLEGFSKLNLRFDNLELEVKGIKWEITGIKASLDKLTEEFLDFKSVTEKEFEITRKLINQAFIKISENLSYIDTIKEMEKVLLKKPKIRQRTTLKEYA